MLNKNPVPDIEAIEKVTNEINNGNVEFMAQPTNHKVKPPLDSSIVQKYTIKPSYSSIPQLQSELQYYCEELNPIPLSILVGYGFQHRHSETTNHFQNQF